jgi:hypothetical protein
MSHVNHTNGRTSRRFDILDSSSGICTSIKPHSSHYLMSRTGCIPHVFLLGSLIIMAKKIHVIIVSKMPTSFHARYLFSTITEITLFYAAVKPPLNYCDIYMSIVYKDFLINSRPYSFYRLVARNKRTQKHSHTVTQSCLTSHT